MGKHAFAIRSLSTAFCFGFGVVFFQLYSSIYMTPLVQSHDIISIILLHLPPPQSSLEVISPKENPNPPI